MTNDVRNKLILSLLPAVAARTPRTPNSAAEVRQYWVSALNEAHSLALLYEQFIRQLEAREQAAKDAKQPAPKPTFPEPGPQQEKTPEQILAQLTGGGDQPPIL